MAQKEEEKERKRERGRMERMWGGMEMDENVALQFKLENQNQAKRWGRDRSMELMPPNYKLNAKVK